MRNRNSIALKTMMVRTVLDSVSDGDIHVFSCGNKVVLLMYRNRLEACPDT
jgi:hypothetical protein